MIDAKFKEKLKQSISLVKLAEDNGIEMERVGTGIYAGHCPKHIDRTPSLIIWTKEHKKNKYDSWACMSCHHGKKNGTDNIGSDCIAFIMWLKNLSFKLSIKYLCDYIGIKMPEDKNIDLIKKRTNEARQYFSNLQRSIVAKDYLINRGLEDVDIKRFGLGYDGDKIVFPLFDIYNQVIGFTKRWLIEPLDCADKYRNSSNDDIFNKSEYFYGLNMIDRSFKELRIVEGPMDMILAYKYGAKNVVATLGTAFTEDHMKFIKNNNFTPVFCYDGDKAGLKAIKSASSLLADNNINSKILLLQDGDIADLANEIKYSIEEYIDINSKTYANYLIQDKLADYKSKLNELNFKFYPELINILNTIPYKQEREFLLEVINKEMNF